MSSRMDEIRAIIEQYPNEPFPRYGLALEYKNQGLLENAHQTFLELSNRFPTYIPLYLMYGQLLVEMKRPEDARKIFEKGLVEAEKAGDYHARGELAQALSQEEKWEEELDEFPI